MFWKKSLWGCKWPTAIERAGEWPTENNNNSSRFMYHLHPTKYFVNWISIWKHNTTFMHTYWSKLPSDLLVELGWPTTRQNTFGGPLCILWYAIHLKYLNVMGGSVLHCTMCYKKSNNIAHCCQLHFEYFSWKLNPSAVLVSTAGIQLQHAEITVNVCIVCNKHFMEYVSHTDGRVTNYHASKFKIGVDLTGLEKTRIIGKLNKALQC